MYGTTETSGRGLNGPHLARLLGAWRSPGRPQYVALADALRLGILDGRLPLGTRLPGERDVAQALSVSRTTASAAYEALRADGFLSTRRGSGSRTTLPPGRGSGPQPSPGPTRVGGGAIDLTIAATEAPAGVLHRALVAATAALPRHLPDPGYYAATGLDVLRAAIAEDLTRRGLKSSPAQVLVTNGAQHGWSLLLDALVRPGVEVVVDHPTYPNALDAIRGAGAHPVPIALGPDGWDLELLSARLRQSRPAFVHVIADHHNPTGLSLPEADRERLVALVRSAGVPLVVDETMAELGFDGASAPAPVGAADPSATTVITLGSMSKAYWAGLRVGWIRAEPALIERLARARAALDLASPVVEQLVAVELLADPDAVLVERRRALRERRDALLAALVAELPAWRVRTVPSGGLALWVDIGAPLATALAAHAPAHGVHVAPGPRFGVGGAFEDHVRLPFSLPRDQLTEGVRRLAAAWVGVTSGGRTPPSAPTRQLVA